jgi:hypothetical protein
MMFLFFSVRANGKDACICWRVDEEFSTSTKSGFHDLFIVVRAVLAIVVALGVLLPQSKGQRFVLNIFARTL